jgi:sulfite reductase beta subunit-like hemoprotein
MSIQEIYECARKDPSLFSTLDIEKLLSSVDKEKHDYLENKTMTSISEEVYQKVVELGIENLHEICSKLVGYRFVDEIHELHKGKHVRWIREGTQKLTAGGLVVNIKFTDTGTHLVTKNAQHRFIQYRFDEAATFQKMTSEEQLIVLAYEQSIS